MTMSCTLVSHDMQSTAALSNKKKMAKKAINKWIGYLLSESSVLAKGSRSVANRLIGGIIDPTVDTDKSDNVKQSGEQELEVW